MQDFAQSQSQSQLHASISNTLQPSASVASSLSSSSSVTAMAPPSMSTYNIAADSAPMAAPVTSNIGSHAEDDQAAAAAAALVERAAQKQRELDLADARFHEAQRSSVSAASPPVVEISQQSQPQSLAVQSSSAPSLRVDNESDRAAEALRRLEAGRAERHAIAAQEAEDAAAAAAAASRSRLAAIQSQIGSPLPLHSIRAAEPAASGAPLAAVAAAPRDAVAALVPEPVAARPSRAELSLDLPLSPVAHAYESPRMASRSVPVSESPSVSIRADPDQSFRADQKQRSLNVNSAIGLQPVRAFSAQTKHTIF
jgi:hypothetical protein